jgi:hypothetical protein
MSFRRILGVSFLLFVLTLSPVHAAPGSPPSVPCPEFPEDQIFRTGNASVYGSTNQFRSVDRPLNINCLAWTPVAGSTAHVYLGNVWCNWAEFGYEEDLGGGYVHDFRLFSEWGLNCNKKSYDTTSHPCIDDHSTYKKFRVASILGSTTWRTYLDCQDGGGWIGPYETYTGTGYTNGTAAGETLRRGGVDTGMDDFQDTLRYKNSNGNWKAWSYNFLDCDTATDWDSAAVSPTSYDVYPGSQTYVSC